MTYASAAAQRRAKIDCTAFVDGLPFLFGTKAGLQHPMDTIRNGPVQVTPTSTVFTAQKPSAFGWTYTASGVGSQTESTLITVVPGEGFMFADTDPEQYGSTYELFDDSILPDGYVEWSFTIRAVNGSQDGSGPGDSGEWGSVKVGIHDGQYAMEFGFWKFDASNSKFGALSPDRDFFFEEGDNVGTVPNASYTKITLKKYGQDRIDIYKNDVFSSSVPIDTDYRSATTDKKLIIYGNASALSGTPDDFRFKSVAYTNKGLVSVNAITDVSFEASELDINLHMVMPAAGKLRIRASRAFDPVKWDPYFETRTPPLRRITNDVDTVDTDLTLNNTDGFTEGQLLYFNRETILCGEVAAPPFNTINGCTRNYCALVGTLPESHYAGAVLASSPRYFIGRRVELRLWLEGQQSEVYALTKLSEDPYFDAATGEWVFAFNDNLKTFDKKIAVGVKPTTALSVAYSADGLYEQVTPTDSRQFQDRSGTGTGGNAGYQNGHVLFQSELFTGIVPLHHWSSAGADPDFFVERFGLDGSPRLIPTGADAGASIQRVWVFQGRPMLAALQVLLSYCGDKTNHATYDVLYGVTAQGAGGGSTELQRGEDEIRFGAAIPADFVDVDALEELAHEVVAGFYYVLGARGEEDLLQFLLEIARAMNGYWFLKDGVSLSFRKFSAAYRADTFTSALNTSNIDRLTQRKSKNDEKPVVHTISIECNWDVVRGGFKGKMNAFYYQEKQTYLETLGTLKVQRKALLVNLGPQQNIPNIAPGALGNYADVETIRLDLDRTFAKRAFGIRTYSILLPWPFHLLRAGDRVTLTYPDLKAFDGSSVNALKVEVVRVQPLLNDGCFEIVVNEIWEGRNLSPTVVVGSFDDGTNIITLSTGANPKAHWGFGDTPGRWFAAGQVVRLLDKSASPRYSSTEDVTVVSVTDTTVTISEPSVKPAVGDLIVLPDYDNATGNANAQQGLTPHDYLFMCNSAVLALGSNYDDPHEWG